MSRANEYVYPSPADNYVEEQRGLTVREHLAAMAMQGLLSRHGDDDYPEEAIARKAAKYADALLAELAKEPK